MRKFRLKNGFTLAEMLIAVLLLALVTSMAVVMTSAVLSTTTTMQEIAQAEILGSEALDNLQREIRFGTNISVKNGGEVLSYKRGVTDCTLGNTDGKIMITTFIKGETNSNELFAGVSYGNLKIAALSFALGDGTEIPKDSVGISVSIAFGEKILWSDSVSVKPLNEHAFSTAGGGTTG